MNGKPISSELTEAPSLTSRVFSFIVPRQLKKWLWWCGGLLAIVVFAFIEIRTSFVQSWIFTSTNKRISFELAAGRSPAIVFPRSAPFDDRRGYSKLANLQARLENQGYHVTEQARQSETMRKLLGRGISPPYVEPPETGMDIRGADGLALFRYAQSDFLFKGVDDI